MSEIVTEQEHLLVELTQQTAEMLNKEEVDPDTPLGELGVDSLNVVELILICEQLYTGILNPEQLSFDEFTTLRDMHNQLLEFSEV